MTNYYFNDDVYTVSREAYNDLQLRLEAQTESTKYLQEEVRDLTESLARQVRHNVKKYDQIVALEQQVVAEQQAFVRLVGEYVKVVEQLGSLEESTGYYRRQLHALQSHVTDLEGTNMHMAEQIVKVPRWLRNLFGSTL